VIAYRDGGVVDTISDTNPKTGIFFDSIIQVISKVLKNLMKKSTA
jgi:hypothetical protein